MQLPAESPPSLLKGLFFAAATVALSTWGLGTLWWASGHADEAGLSAVSRLTPAAQVAAGTENPSAG